MKNFSTKEHSQIESKLAKLKAYWYQVYPICIFCLQGVRPGAGQLCHKVPRSWISKYFSNFELQTKPENTGLGHPACHRTYDDNKKLASKSLPGFWIVMNDIKSFEPDYYNVITEKL